MIKQKMFFIAALLATQVAQAKDHVVVVNTTGKPIKGNTEVKGDSLTGDTLIVTPGSKVEAIQISVKDIEGNVISLDVVPASIPGSYDVGTPTLPDGYVLEIKDDERFVYTSYEF